jgi:succinylglutamate desuccinylase
VPLKKLLDRFATLARPHHFRAPDVHHRPAPAGPHAVFSFLVHGNEWGTLPAAIRVLEELETGALAAPGPVTLFVGNRAAALADQRFLEEDLNRVFTFDRPAESLERKRAEELRPVLDEADFFLDLHQTQTPTERAFWTFPWDPSFDQFARALAVAEVGLTRPGGQAFSPGLCCLDEYVRARKKLAITVEVGMRGLDDKQSERAYQAVVRSLQILTRLESGEKLQAIADENPPLQYYQTHHIVKAETPEHALRPGYQNWSVVDSGDILSAEGAPLLTAPVSGVALFPKYPTSGMAPPPELMRIASPIAEPSVLAAEFG